MDAKLKKGGGGVLTYSLKYTKAVYDKRLNEGEWSDEDEENDLEELQTERLIYFFLFKRINMWYHDAFHYFLSIYVRFSQLLSGQ